MLYRIFQEFSNRTHETQNLPCDPYGDNLCRATLPRGAWIIKHDDILNELKSLVDWAGVECEVDATKTVEGVEILDSNRHENIFRHLGKRHGS